MTIVFFSTMTSFAWGGSEELWAAAAREALAAGHRVAISVPRWRPQAPRLQQLQEAGAVLVERRRFRSNKLRRLVERLALHDWFLQRLRPAVLCISQGATYDFLMGPTRATLDQLTAGRRIPYVVVCQYNDEMLLTNSALRPRAATFLGSATRVVFVAEHNRRLAERQLAIRLPNAALGQNPVNLRSTAAVPWPAAQSTARFCCVARLETRHKAQDVLLEALAAPPWSERAWELRCYGAGPDHEYLRQLAHMFGIADRVRFMGHVADVRAVWTDNEMLVLPSFGEGTPLALIEAMLCGRPAVVTDVGGNAEWVSEGATGFVAAAVSADSLGAALERAWTAREQWQEMGGQARATALARYDSNPGKSLLRILEDVSRPAAGAPR